jgi:hypothetical protein
MQLAPTDVPPVWTADEPLCVATEHLWRRWAGRIHFCRRCRRCGRLGLHT